MKYPRGIINILQPVRRNARYSKKKVKTTASGKQIRQDSVSSSWPAPLILTANDYQARCLSELKKATVRAGASTNKKDNKLMMVVFFDRIPVVLMRKRLHQICVAEGIEPVGLDMICRCSFGDLRRAIILLEEACRVTSQGRDGRRWMIDEQVKIACRYLRFLLRTALGSNLIRQAVCLSFPASPRNRQQGLVLSAAF